MRMKINHETRKHNNNNINKIKDGKNMVTRKRVWHYCPNLTKYAGFLYSKFCYKQKFIKLVLGTCPTFYVSRSAPVKLLWVFCGWVDVLEICLV